MTKLSNTKEADYMNKKSKKGLKRERISIKVKLIVGSMIIAILPMLLVAVILYSQSVKTILNKVDSSNTAYVKKTSENIQMKLGDVDAVSLLIAKDSDITSVLKKNESDYDNPYNMTKERNDYITTVIYDLKKVNKWIEGIYFIQEDEIINPDGYLEGIVDLEAFHEAFLKSDVYTIVKDAKLSPVWFYDLYDTDHIFYMRELNDSISFKSVGIMIVEVNKALLEEQLMIEEFGEKAKVSLIDKDGYVITSTVPERKGQIITLFDDLKPHLDSGDTVGSFTSELGLDEEYHVIYEWFGDFIYILEVPNSFLLEDINATRVYTIIISIVVGIMAIFAAVGISFSISKPIDYIKNKMKKLEQGYLNVKSEYYGKHEIGQLSHSFNEMTLNMNHLIGTIGHVTNNVTKNSNELNAISKISANSSQEVITTLESVADGAITQVEAIRHTEDITKHLIEEFRRTELYFESVISATDDTVSITREAESTVKSLSNTTNDAMHISKRIQVDVKDLVSRFMQITKIISMIEGISEQTNLLSLNASIEAARAGESGKGFAVISAEIRSLAEQSGVAAKSISDMINNMNQATKETEVIIDESLEVYIKQEKAVQLTEEKFHDITENMSAIMDKIDKASDVLKGLDAIQTDVNSAVTKSVSISENAAAAIEELLASGQEQMASAETLVTMSSSLNDSISEINDELSRFIVE